MKINKKTPFCIAVVGPTAVGKSDFAIALAKKLGGEIISADSRQVYKGLDIGSGKVTKREMRRVPHHLLDVAQLLPKNKKPAPRFSVSDFKKLAQEKIEDIFARGHIPIICGGTGLYVDTLLSGAVYPEVAPNKKLRDELGKKTAEELFFILKKLDAGRAKTIDAKNPVRLIRAIEIAKALGNVPKIKNKAKHKTLYVGLNTDDAQLRSNIHERLLKRISIGMIEEVQKLQKGTNGKNGVSWARLEELGLEYKYCALFLQKKITKSHMLETLEKEIWQYAKRQRTWWKKNKDIVWIT